MGGSQSTASSTSSYVSNQTVFSYDCSAEVADFLNSNPTYYQELVTLVGNYADVRHISSNGAKGDVSLKAKLNTSPSDISTCKQKLDDFFEKFKTFEETLEKIIPRQTLDHILNSQGSKCVTRENPSKNSIRITGKSSDVRKMVNMLRDVQNPPPSDPPSPVAKPRSTPASKPSSRPPPVSPPSASSNGSYDLYSSPPSQLSTGATTRPLHTAMSGLAVTTNLLPRSSRSSTPSASPGSSTSSSRSRVAASRSIAPPAALPVLPKNELFLPPLSHFIVFQHPADDWAVARFIKNSSEHSSKLDSAFQQLAEVTILNQVRGEKKVEYHFRPASDLRITEETFQDSCKETLSEFLKGYASRKRHFNSEHIQKVNEKVPDFFRKKSVEESDGVFVLWHVDNSLLILAGLKDEVEKKEKEITDFLHKTVPRYVDSNFLFKQKAFDYSVARFLKESPLHMSKFENSLSDFASSVKVWIRNDKGDGEKLIEYQCRPLPGLEMTEAKFRSKCRSEISKFLENYSSEKKYFNRDHLMKVVAIEPEFFKKRSAQENQVLFLEWHLDENKLRIAGLKVEVDAKLQNIIRYLDEAVPKKRFVAPKYIFKWKTQDLSVARFLKQSTSHLSKLEGLLSGIATVRVWISHEKGKNQDTEYQLKPVPGVELSHDEYNKTCKDILMKFLQDYATTKKYFNHELLMKAALKNPDFFKQRTSQENEALYVLWQLDQNKVRITGPKKDLEAKVQEIDEYLNTAVPRTLRNAYEFDMPVPNPLIAKFVKQNEKHNDALKEAVSDAKVWITPGERAIHFKAIVELSQIDIPKFENDCKTAAVAFFKKYDTWHQTQSKAVIERFKTSHSEWISGDVDWKVEIRSGNDVTLVGIKPVFAKKRTELIAAIKKISNEIKSQNKKPSPQLHEPGPSNALPDVFQPYIYQPNAKANQTIIKHVFQSPEDLSVLRNLLGVFINFEFFPSSGEPKGIKFYPATGAMLDPGYYNYEIPEKIKEFFTRFSVSRKKCSSERDAKQVVDAVYEIGLRRGVGERMMSLHREGDFLNIAGPKPLTMEISRCINGINCDGELNWKPSPQHDAASQPEPLNALPDVFQPYIYQPNAKANQTIIKHVFQSPEDVRELHNLLGVFINFEFFPSSGEPKGIKFYPATGAMLDPGYYDHEVPARIKGFFTRFSVSRKKCSSERDAKQVVDAVYEIGLRRGVGERMMSLHREGDFLNIAGPKLLTMEISRCINGINCDGELNIQLRKIPVPQTKSRRNSNSSTASGDTPKPRSRRRSTTPKPATPKKTAEKPSFVYNPEKTFTPLFKFVLHEERFYNELKSRLIDLCIITETVGVVDQVKIAPKDKENDPLFSKKVVEQMENYLNLITIVNLELGTEVVQFFLENKEHWCSQFHSADDWVVLSWQEKSVEIKGFKDDVAKCEAAIKSWIEEDALKLPFTPEICRIMSICGVLAETNRQLGGKASCSIDGGSVLCTGKKCYLDHAKQTLGKVGHLEEEPPQLTEEKMKALEKFLTQKNRQANEDFIEKKFAEKRIKCVLMHQAGKAILFAMTKEMYRKGSKCIDELLQVVDVPLPDSLAKDIFLRNDWKLLSAQISASKPILVQVKNDCIRLIGLDSSDLEEAKNKINQFLADKLTCTRNIQCKRKHVKKFILTHLAPPNLKLSAIEPGLAVSGNSDEVDSFVQSLKGKFKTEELSFSAPELSTFFSCDQWQGFVKLVEHGLRCTICCDGAKDRQAILEEEEKTASSAFNRGDFAAGSVQQASYGTVSVSVCRGDVTKETSDVIINGVMDRNFDLTRGTVSSALLKRAGPRMQLECSGADQASSTIRYTKGGNLLCDYVIHVVTPHEADKLTKRIKEALDHAELLKANSVSLPTLGAGGIGINAMEVASALSKAFELFAREKPRYVKTIRLVVYEPSLVDLFKTSIVRAKETMGFGKRAAELAEAKAQSLQHDDVIVSLCSDDANTLANAKDRVVHYMSNVIVVKKMKEEIISELEDNDRLDIFEAAVKHKAAVSLSCVTSEIVLTGLSTNVSQLYNDVRELLFELREAMTISKMIVWKWASTTDIYNALPLRVSRALEKEYEKTKSGTTSVSLCGSSLIVNFSSESFDYQQISGKIKREDSDKIPSDWEDMLGRHWMKVSLDRNSAEYNRVLQLFESSSPSHSHVVSIERVQNPPLFKQYLIKKNEVERHMITNNSAERELFHGTSQSDAEKICADGFDRNFAGKNATVYGKGCYFAVNSSYSVGYSGGASLGVKCVFLARVLTGDFCKGNHNMVAPPEKLQSGDIVRKYDSVVDDENNPTIFVVFKDSSVYPYYLISFC